MGSQLPSPQMVRFGVFEVDFQAHELRKSGLKLKLHDQPFQVLGALLERPGEVVTREELRQRLWPVSTFVDFDHSLNTAVNKLREVLGDSADSPRFIETVPRRGYRFIVPGSYDQSAQRQPTVRDKPRPRWRRTATIVSVPVSLLAVLVAYGWVAPLPAPNLAHPVQLTHDGRPKHRPLMTDGLRLYYLAHAPNGKLTVVQVPVVGGEPTALPTPFAVTWPLDVSPDGSELLVLNDEAYMKWAVPLWILPLSEGSPQRVGNVFAHWAAWCPDGQRIVYTNESEVYLTDRSGTTLRKLASGHGRPGPPNWSPDGKRIRFSEWDPKTGSTSIWQVTPEGTDLHSVIPSQHGAPAVCCGRWTPDGKYFLFVRQEHLWFIREKQSPFRLGSQSATQLTTGPSAVVDVVPSRDGKKLFVIGPHDPRVQLLRHDLKSHQTMTFLPGISAEQLAFSRDGRWVAYVTYPEANVWRSRVDGSDRLQLTFAPLSARFPRWSPDGRQIAFHASVRGGLEEIYLVSADGGSPHRPIQDGRSQADPMWLPDGNRLIFSRSILEIGGAQALHMFDMRTHEVSKLPGSADMAGPRVSPDGRYVAASFRYGQPDHKLMLFSFAAQKWRELTTIQVHHREWSPDGKYIYFDSDYVRNPGVFRVRIADAKVELALSFREFQPEEGIYGPWCGVAPDGSILATRDVGSQEIYSLDWQEP